MKSLLVTGAAGFVGGSVVSQAPEGLRVCAVSGKPQTFFHPSLTWRHCNLLDVDTLGKLFREIRPEAVIHAAAIADIDYCEIHPDEAREVNAHLTRRMAGLCGEFGARMILLSTDTIFDGRRGNYTEDDLPAPVNVYAETKAAAEAATRELTDGSWTIARVALVMGLPLLGGGNSFLSRMIHLLESGQPVGVPIGETRTPIDVVTLARALIEIAQRGLAGIFHLGGNDRLDRVAMSRRIAQLMGFPAQLIVPNDAAKIPGRAPRPLDVSLDNRKARSLLRTPFLGLEDGLRLALETADYGSRLRRAGTP